MIPSATYTTDVFQRAGQFPKIAPWRGGSPLPSSTWFLGDTQISPPNDISIGSAVFAWHIQLTNTQTDRPRYVRHL